MRKLSNLDLNKIKNIELNNEIFRLIYNKIDYILYKISKKYGISFNDEVKNNLFCMTIYVEYKMYGNINSECIHKEIQRVKNNNQKAFQIAHKIISNLNEDKEDEYKILYLFYPVIISDILKSNTKIQAIIACHGDSTASSISSVANTLCGTYIYEPFDMAITDNSRDIFQKVNKYIDDIDTSNGLILLVDMGSLQEMYEPIKNHLQGELLIINNVTTNIAVDIGLKMSQGNTLQDIIAKSKDALNTELRYYEGIAKGDNIIISCISGMGIAHKLKTIFEKCIENSRLEIITIEYSKLKKLIQLDKSSQFKRTKLIITTNKLDTSIIPSINIEDILSDKQHEMLAYYLSNILSKVEIKNISDEIIKFFSVEGISSQLVFLNPNIVVNDVYNIIKQYEEYYNVSFESHLRLNLYMHISIMIERLMTSKIKEVQEKEISEKHVKEFINITQSIFDEIKKKYHIQIPLIEIMFIYEIIESQISRK